jgi:hypothetical protein
LSPNSQHQASILPTYPYVPEDEVIQAADLRLASGTRAWGRCRHNGEIGKVEHKTEWLLTIPNPTLAFLDPILEPLGPASTVRLVPSLFRYHV